MGKIIWSSDGRSLSKKWSTSLILSDSKAATSAQILPRPLALKHTAQPIKGNNVISKKVDVLRLQMTLVI